MIEFSSSEELMAYYRKNAHYTRCGDISIPEESFIDSKDLHIFFSNRSDYELWDMLRSNGEWFSQISLF